jgi:hypothetical protein
MTFHTTNEVVDDTGSVCVAVSAAVRMGTTARKRCLAVAVFKGFS